MAQSQTAFFGNDTTLAETLPGLDAVVGFANQTDFSARTPKSSPTIDIVSGGGRFLVMNVYNESVVILRGGALNNLNGLDQSTLVIRGGTLGAGLTSSGTSVIYMAGGSVGYLTTSATANWSGGTINGLTSVIGTGVLRIYGSGLKAVLKNGNASGSSIYGLSGTLVDGTVLVDRPLRRENGTGASFVLLPIPRLSVVRTADSLTLKWPAELSNFLVESAPALSLGADWQQVSGVRKLQGPEWTITLHPASSEQYFRLRSAN